MKQELNVNLTGSIGDKIKVDVDQSSNVQTSLDNKVKLRYEGDEDDMIKTVELGNTNLSPRAPRSARKGCSVSRRRPSSGTGTSSRSRASRKARTRPPASRRRATGPRSSSAMSTTSSVFLAHRPLRADRLRRKRVRIGAAARGLQEGPLERQDGIDPGWRGSTPRALRTA